MDSLPDDECALLVVAFDGDDGDIGATAVDTVVVSVAAPAGTDCDDSVGVVAGGGGEFSVVPADPRPMTMSSNRFLSNDRFRCFEMANPYGFNFTCCCCCFG